MPLGTQGSQRWGQQEATPIIHTDEYPQITHCMHTCGPECCRQRTLEKKLQREQQRIRRMEGADAAAAGSSQAAKSKDKVAVPAKEEEPPTDIDDDDLIASTAGVGQQAEDGSSGAGQQAHARGLFQPPTVLASMSLGLSRAAATLHNAFHQTAVRAAQRRTLTRPRHAA